AEELFARPQDPTDNVTPSGRNAAASALLMYAALTGSERHRSGAETALAPVSVLAEKAPRFAGWGLATGETLQSRLSAVAVVGAPDDPAVDELFRAALESAPLGTVFTRGDGVDDGGVPLLTGRAAL